MTMESQQITKITWSKDAMIDYMLANPGAHQRDIARVFDRTETWISIVINSDVFITALEERRREFTDPILQTTIKDRLQAMANVSIEAVLDRLTRPGVAPKDNFLLEAAKLSTHALGFGQAKPQGPTTAVQFVVNMPGKMDASEWSATYAIPATPPDSQA